MFEDFSLINPTEQKTELPSVIRIGNFQRGSSSIPVLLPIDILNGLCFETNFDTQEGVLRQMQYIALDLIKQVQQEVLNITLVDIGLNTNFPLLHSLKLPNIHFINNKDNLRNEISRLYDKARYISTKCLKADYANLIEYNKNATYKEAYNFLFIPNFPKDYKEEEINAISDLINEGSKCGIQIIMNLNRSYFPHTNTYNIHHFQKLYSLINEITYINCTLPNAEIKNFEVKIMQDWFAKYLFCFDIYDASAIQKIVYTLNQTHKEQDNQFENFLSIPIGQLGRERTNFEMGQKAGVYQGLIAGQSGTGKSTLLNNIITTIALNYSPDEMRLYLLDYKLGVEFKIYQNHPNVELLLLDNSRLSVAVDALKRLVDEMDKREKLFDIDLTIQDIDSYNKIAKNKLPRILIIIDEVQQLFKDYETKRQVTPLIKSIAKQGRSFGIHMLFSSQSYEGYNIDSDILAQMSLRIAFTLANGAECRAILSGDNDAPKFLPYYSAVYNTKNGNKEANVIVKLDDFKRDTIISKLSDATKKHSHYEPFDKIIITRHTPQNQDSTIKANSKKSNEDMDIWN